MAYRAATLLVNSGIHAPSSKFDFCIPLDARLMPSAVEVRPHGSAAKRKLKTHGAEQAHCLNTTGGPLTRFPLRSTVTSTRSAIFMKGMPLFIANSFRSKAIVPVIEPAPVPLPVIAKVSFLAFDTLAW